MIIPHSSQVLGQPLCCSAFKAAWRRHFAATRARLRKREPSTKELRGFLRRHLHRRRPQLRWLNQLARSRRQLGGDMWLPQPRPQLFFFLFGPVQVLGLGWLMGCRGSGVGQRSGAPVPYGEEGSKAFLQSPASRKIYIKQITLRHLSLYFSPVTKFFSGELN